MKKRLTSPHVQQLYLIIALLMTVTFSLRFAGGVGAQVENCVYPNVTTDSLAFPQNAQITVHVNSNQFTQTEFQCLQTAFNNWNQANQTNWSGVQFNVSYSAQVLVTTSGGVVSGGTNVYQVDKSTDFLGSQLVAGTGGKPDGDHRKNAFTNIHPN